MIEDRGVRVIRPFQQFQVGRILFPPAIFREGLIKQGWVEVVEDVPAAPVNREMRTKRFSRGG